jgi:aspartate 1-decarboxylase
VQPGDKVIVITYAQYDAEELAGYEPSVVHVDAANRPVEAAVVGNDRGLHAVNP